MKTRRSNGNGRLAELERLFADQAFSYRYARQRIPLEAIRILQQPRQTFENIPELGEDIAQKGLLNPPVVATFSEDHLRDYLQALNYLWGTAYQVTDLKPLKGRYYVLIAGERRFRACRYLWEHGCEDCNRFGPIGIGQCFIEHFHDQTLEVSLCRDIPPAAALFLQLSENTHMRVPPHEEAHAYSKLFKLLRRVEPKYPIARFARRVGRGPEAIRNALRYCDLPLVIQDAVEAGKVGYGIAIEISRLKEAGCADERLIRELNYAIVNRMKQPDFRQRITDYLEALRSGQQSLLSLMQDTAALLTRRSEFRHVVERNLIQGLWSYLSYFRKVVWLFEQGHLDAKDSPLAKKPLYSARSPGRLLRELATTMREALPCLRRAIPKKDQPRIRTTLKHIERLADRVEALEAVAGEAA